MLLAGAILLAVFVVEGPWGLVLVGAAGVLEVGESLFWIRLSRRKPAQTGREALVGARARVVSDCRPDGQVRVYGELWQARCSAGADVGELVRVRMVDGLTLDVEPER